MPRRFHCLSASILLAFGLAAQAADPTPPAAPRKGNVLTLSGGKPTGKLLTRDQLRQCLASQTALKQQDDEAAKAQAVLDADKAAIARLDAEQTQQAAALQAERANVDLKDEAAVAAFNAKLAQRAESETRRNQLVADYNAKLAPFNAQVKAVNQTRDVWQAGCADRSYDEADYFAIQRGK
jgi:hypothetical protein